MERQSKRLDSGMTRKATVYIHSCTTDSSGMGMERKKPPLINRVKPWVYLGCLLPVLYGSLTQPSCTPLFLLVFLVLIGVLEPRVHRTLLRIGQAVGRLTTFVKA